MKTREVLTLSGIGLLGIYLLCTIFLMMAKNKKMAEQSKSAAIILLFMSVAALTISQFMKETEVEDFQ